MTPDPAPGVGTTITALPDVSGIVDRFGPPLPGRLARMTRVPVPSGLADVAAYGAGFSRFAVLPLPSRVGQSALNAAQSAGAGGVSLSGGTGALIETPLLTVLLAQSQFGGPVYLLTGAVTPALLVRAGSDLLNDRERIMIVTRALTKRYGRVLAVDRVDLEVREGDRYGFLGPNGSGKTTVVRMLLGLVYATSGEIEVMGRPVPSRVAEVLPRIGALIEGPSCYGHLSGRANLGADRRLGKAPGPAQPQAADR